MHSKRILDSGDVFKQTEREQIFFRWSKLDRNFGLFLSELIFIQVVLRVAKWQARLKQSYPDLFPDYI